MTAVLIVVLFALFGGLIGAAIPLMSKKDRSELIGKAVKAGVIGLVVGLVIGGAVDVIQLTSGHHSGSSASSSSQGTGKLPS